MPFPRWLARLNKRVTNPLLMPLARRLPAGAIVVHQGRRSGREYQTPVAAFTTEDGFVLALTYGPGADWVRNLVAAGKGVLRRRGRTVVVHRPQVVGAAVGAPLVPWFARLVLRLARSDDFLLVAVAPQAGTSADSEPAR